MPTSQEYAQLANRVYFRTARNRTPVPVESGWTELEWIPDVSLVGFSAGVYRKGNDIVVSYTGTNDSKVGDTVWGNLPAATGLSPSTQVLAAMVLYLEVKRANPGANITFTGHSLGGGLASMMAVFFDRPAVVFDPAPFQAGAQSLTSLAWYSAALLGLGHADPAFDIYRNSFATTFFGRESNVSGFWLEGEFLNIGRTELTSIGTYTMVPAGGQTAAADALHSMTALAAMLTSTAFATAVRKTPTLLELMLDGGIYYRDPATFTQQNLIDRLYIAQVSNPSAPLLDRFAADIERLVASLDGMAAQGSIQKGLIVAAMEYYYFNDPASRTALFATSGNGIHFKYSDSGATDFEALPRLVNAVNAYLSNDELRALGAITDQAQIRNDFGTGRLLGQDAWHVQAGTSGMIWTATGSDKDAAIGGAQTDILDAGAGDDILVGGAGQDFLTGGANNDTLIGGVDLDWLDGGEGDDKLLGGQGADIYHFTAGWGVDTIEDSDGQGSIVVDGVTLDGANARLKSEGGYTDGQWLYTLVPNGRGGNDLILERVGTVDKIRIRDWSEARNLGITLNNTAATVATNNVFDGEFIKKTGTDGVTYVKGSDGNYVSAGAAANTKDDINGTAGNDKMTGGGNTDGLAGLAGDDDIDGGDGDDLLVGGVGADWLKGGAGNDRIFGSGGGITLIGSSAQAPVADGPELLRGASWVVYQAPVPDSYGSYVTWYRNVGLGAGDTGSNVIDGGANTDWVAAGTGGDVVCGGAGNDAHYLGSNYFDDGCRNGEGNDGPLERQGRACRFFDGNGRYGLFVARRCTADWGRHRRTGPVAGAHSNAAQVVSRQGFAAW